jgi:hypothetical protein
MDLDLAMFSGNYNACVVHGEHLIYVSTFPSNICHQIYLQAFEACNLDTSVNESFLAGIKTSGNSDAMQKDETAVYTTNFGILVWPFPAAARTLILSLVPIEVVQLLFLIFNLVFRLLSVSCTSMISFLYSTKKTYQYLTGGMGQEQMESGHFQSLPSHGYIPSYEFAQRFGCCCRKRM